MTAISVADFTDYTQHVILPKDIIERILLLRRWLDEAPQEGEGPDSDWMAEVEELRAFWKDAETRTGKDFDDVIILPTDQASAYARDRWEESIEGLTQLSHRIDWDGVGRDILMDFTTLPFGDETVYVR